MNEVTIFTSGCTEYISSGSPGGYGVIMVSGDHYKEISGGYRFTNSIRLELMAILTALHSLKRNGLTVHLYSSNSTIRYAFRRNLFFRWIKSRVDFDNKDLWMEIWRATMGQNIVIHDAYGLKDDLRKSFNKCKEIAQYTAMYDANRVDNVFEASLGRFDIPSSFSQSVYA